MCACHVVQAVQQAEHAATVARDAEKAAQHKAGRYGQKQKQLDQLAALKQVPPCTVKSQHYIYLH